MDSGRENRRGVYRVRNEQRRPGPASSQSRVVSGEHSTCTRLRHIVLEDADMGMAIGPILKGADGYEFDAGDASEGGSPDDPFRRIGDAHGARNIAQRS